MPLFAILRVDADQLHPGSCILIEAASLMAIAQAMLDQPDRWKILLETLYPDETDARSLWQRLQTDALTPQQLLRLINQTQIGDDWIQMVRIQPIKIRSLEELKIETIWTPSHLDGDDCDKVRRL